MHARAIPVCTKPDIAVINGSLWNVTIPTTLIGQRTQYSTAEIAHSIAIETYEARALQLVTFILAFCDGSNVIPQHVAATTLTIL
jgi:hypothetical protein